MGEELSYRAEAAAEYDRAFSHVSAHFLPFLLRAAHLGPGQRVLDVATGTDAIGSATLASILKGATPADLPIEQPTETKLAINLVAAKRFG